MAADSTNKPPQNGRFVLVTVGVTNLGKIASDPFLDSFITVDGADGKKYYDLDCEADLKDGLIDVGKPSTGKSSSGALGFDVPAAAVNGGGWHLSVYQSGDEGYWKLD